MRPTSNAAGRDASAAECHRIYEMGHLASDASSWRAGPRDQVLKNGRLRCEASRKSAIIAAPYPHLRSHSRDPGGRLRKPTLWMSSLTSCLLMTMAESALAAGPSV